MELSSIQQVETENTYLKLDTILQHEQIVTYYQPIVNLQTGQIVGYEALSRGPQYSPFYSPLSLIEEAKKQDRLWELELLFRKKAFQKIDQLKRDQKLFINVDPNVIESEEYQRGLTKILLEDYRASQRNVVFEITERTAIFDYKAFTGVLNNYRNHGYQIAIDDVGSGHSGLVAINEVRPDIIKIDISLIRNIDKDAYKQALIRSFVDTSATTNTKVVAEGIESVEEMRTLIMLGVHYGQGYYLQKPSPQIEVLPEALCQEIVKANHISNNLRDYASDYHYISNLIDEKLNLVFEPMTQSLTVKKALAVSAVSSACICERGRPVGLVMENKLDACLSGQFGYSLYSNNSIAKVINKNALIVDAYTPIYQVAKYAMERLDENLYDDIIVTKGGAYNGTVRMKIIIEYALMYEKNCAKELNPLTDLPGNPVINRVLQDSISLDEKACLMYVDINDFKVYNDVYGFEKGDAMILYLAENLQNVIKNNFPINAFIGHIGGDDFVVVLRDKKKKCLEAAKLLIDCFDKNKARFFSDKHLNSGTICSQDRYGVMRQFKLTSISVAMLYGKLNKFDDSDALSETLAELKKTVKKQVNCHYLLKTVEQLKS